MAANQKKTRTRRRERKNIEKGQVHINSTFNNSMVTITDTQGNALSCTATEALWPLSCPNGAGNSFLP